MPIRPENRARYPKDWKRISASIRERAGNKCEWCGAPNGETGARDRNGKWHNEDDIHRMNSAVGMELFGDFPECKKIVLTVAHLDHTPENCDPANLRALCQKCHNGYDAKTRAAGIKQRRDKAKEKEDFIGKVEA